MEDKFIQDNLLGLRKSNLNKNSFIFYTEKKKRNALERSVRGWSLLDIKSIKKENSTLKIKINLKI